MKKKTSTLVATILQLLMGGILGFMITKNILSKDNLSFLDIIIFLIIFFVAFNIQLIIHEGGHLIFGLLTGYSFLSFRIFSFMWVKQGKKIAFKRFSLTGTAGQCLLAPPDDHDDNYPVILYNLGGSLLNLTVSLICLILLSFFKDIPLLSCLMFILSIVGIYLSLINGIPLQLNGIDNDGFNALYTYKDKLARKAFWTTLKINQLNTNNIRLKDVDEKLFPKLEVQQITNSLITSLIVTQFQREIDQHDFNKAISTFNFIDNNNLPLAGIHKNILINDYIFCLLMTDNQVELSTLYTKQFNQFIKAMKKMPSIIRTQYAYQLLFNEDEAEAQKHLDLFNQVIRTYPYQSDIESEQELIAYINHLYKDKKTLQK